MTEPVVGSALSTGASSFSHGLAAPGRGNAPQDQGTVFDTSHDLTGNPQPEMARLQCRPAGTKSSHTKVVESPEYPDPNTFSINMIFDNQVIIFFPILNTWNSFFVSSSQNFDFAHSKPHDITIFCAPLLWPSKSQCICRIHHLIWVV